MVSQSKHYRDTANQGILSLNKLKLKIMLHHLKLSADLIIASIIVFGALLGLLLGHERIKFFALSAYVGLVLGDTLGGPAYDLARGHGVNLTAGDVRLIVFGLPIIILILSHRPKAKARHKHVFVALVLGLLVAAMIMASILHLLDSSTAARITESSQIAWWLDHLRLVWLVAIPGVALIELFTKDKAKH